MGHLGRGGNSVILDGLTARKKVVGTWEPEYMQRHRDVFVQVISVSEFGEGRCGPIEFSMVEGQGATHEDLRDALPKAASLLKQLWQYAWPEHNPDWKRALYDHLLEVTQRQDLQLTKLDLAWLVRQADHHQLKMGRCIHGDPTLANLVYDARLPHSRWRWIDPLTRPYIPGDPLVDLGKLYQSCLGYERVLAGLEPERDDALIESLAEQLGLCEYHGLVWTAIHLIRLIPYQREQDKPVFAHMLHDLLDELRNEKEEGDDE